MNLYFFVNCAILARVVLDYSQREYVITHNSLRNCDQ